MGVIKIGRIYGTQRERIEKLTVVATLLLVNRNLRQTIIDLFSAIALLITSPHHNHPSNAIIYEFSRHPIDINRLYGPYDSNFRHFLTDTMEKYFLLSAIERVEKWTKKLSFDSYRKKLKYASVWTIISSLNPETKPKRSFKLPPHPLGTAPKTQPLIPRQFFLI